MKILLALLALSTLTLIGCTSGKCPFGMKKAAGSACCAEKKAECCSH